MDSYLAIAARTLWAHAKPPADERDAGNETSSDRQPRPGASFVSFVSCVGPPPWPGVAEPVAWACDGDNFDGISDRLLATLRAQAGAVRLADYLAGCDRGEVRWPAHPLDGELAQWNRRCKAPASDKKRK